ncbi:MAG: hypothetical protein Kow006_07320 [Gammaproteobacteria bacterium]
MQFITRYLFAAMGVLYLVAAEGHPPHLLGFGELLGLLAAYALFNTVWFAKALRSRGERTPHRFLMWVDVVLMALFLVVDPYPVPLSILAFVMIIIGNGMRYGIGMFREALLACFSASALSLSIRHGLLDEPMNAGIAFLIALAALIVIYCYALMERIHASQLELLKLSRYDPLTGLLNRRGLFESAEILFQYLRRSGHPVTVIFADMDRFKLVNDTRGHAEGDRVLRAVGRILKRAVRGSDLVARYGGDEFVIILPDATTEQAARVTTTLRRQISELVDEIDVPIGVSFGIREMVAEEIDLHQVLIEVDRDMYRSKHRTTPPVLTENGEPDPLDPCGETAG